MTLAGLAQVGRMDRCPAGDNRIGQRTGVEFGKAHAGFCQPGEIDIEAGDAIDRQCKTQCRQAAKAVEPGAVQGSNAVMGEFQHDVAGALAFALQEIV